jgi:hypothetical protein
MASERQQAHTHKRVPAAHPRTYGGGIKQTNKLNSKSRNSIRISFILFGVLRILFTGVYMPLRALDVQDAQNALS